MTNIPKHQKGSQLKAIMQQKIDSGFFNKKDAREAKKALQYIEDDLFYFKNSDGTYSVRQEQQGTTTTDKDGNAVTVDPQLEVTTNAVGLHSNTGPLSLSRLGVGQGNKGSRKVANVMGYLMKSGDMTDYDSYRKAQEAKKAEEDKKNNPIKTEGTGATLNEDQSSLTNAEQDTIISNQIASIKDSDIIYVNSTIDQVEAQYGLKEGDPIPNSVKTITNADGETMYQIPTTNITTGGGAKETFVLDKSTGTWQVGSPLAGDASAIESYTPSKANFTGSSALDYQKFLAEQMKEKLISGEVTEAQLQEKGINPNNLFNTTKNVSEYAKIISMTGDANSDQGQSTDGSGKTFSTGFDGLIGGATGKVEELLGITRPSNLQKTKSSGTKTTKTGSSASSGTGSTGTVSLAQMMASIETNLNNAAAVKKQGGTIPTRKKGGITFSVVKKFQPGGSNNSVQLRIDVIKKEIKNILNPPGKDPLNNQFKLIAGQIGAEYPGFVIPTNKEKDVATQLTPIYTESVKLGSLLRELEVLQSGGETETATTTTTQGDSSKLATVEANQTISDTGTRMGDFVIDDAEEKMARVGYGSGIQDMYQTVQGLESTVNKLPDNPTEDQINKVRDFIVKQALALKTSADASYKALDSDWAKYETSGKGLFWDTKGSPSQVLKDLEASFFDLSESAKRAKTKEDLLALIQSIPQPKIESQKQGGKFALGGRIDDMTYDLLKYKGYSDEKILSLVEANQQTTVNTTTVGGTPVTDEAGSIIVNADEVKGNASLAEIAGTTVGSAATLGGLYFGGKKGFRVAAKLIAKKWGKNQTEDVIEEVATEIASSTPKKGWVNKVKDFTGYGKTKEELEAMKKQLAALEDAKKANQTNTGQVGDTNAVGSGSTTNTQTSNTGTSTLNKTKSVFQNTSAKAQENRMFTLLDKRATKGLDEIEEKELITAVSEVAKTNPAAKDLLSTLTRVSKEEPVKAIKTVANTAYAVGEPKTISDLLKLRQQKKTAQNWSQGIKDQTISPTIQSNTIIPGKEYLGIIPKGQKFFDEGGKTQFTPIATDGEGIKFKASQSGKVYYDAGDGVWTEAGSQEIYDYGKEIIQSQVKPQKTQEKETQVQEAQEPDQVDSFLNKNQWIPFVGAPTRRKEMDAFDYLTFAGGFVPVVGAGFEAVEAARNLYDEYQANDLDWQDVARNAGEIGVSFVGGKAIGGLGTMGKNAWKAMRKAQDGMKMEKPIINIKELGDNKIIGFKGFKLSKYKKGGKVPPQRESVSQSVKTSKYDHLNKYINKI